MPFNIIRDNITHVKADAVVNTANPQVTVGAGVDAAIYEAAGREKLLKARAEIGILEPGEIGVTKGYALPAKYIIHVSGPVWADGTKGEAGILRQCYDKALAKAVELKCKSIAFPLISGGTYGFPKDEALQTALSAFNVFLMKNDIEIILVVFDQETTRLSDNLFSDVQKYVDDNYVEEYAAQMSARTFAATPQGGAVFKNSEPRKSEKRLFTAPRRKEALEASEFSAAKEASDAGYFPEAKSFTDYLIKLLNKKGLSNSEVYNSIGMTRQYFSKLLSGKIEPSKEKLLEIAVALRLNIDETTDFLACAGYALSRFSKTDLVYEYYIKKQIYDYTTISTALFEQGLYKKEA